MYLDICCKMKNIVWKEEKMDMQTKKQAESAKTQPLVSVCIPAYNNAGYIKETIDSILNQTYKNIELIIVDDNSKDNTSEVVKSIADDRIKLYRNDKNLGMSGNWSYCLSLCTGEFMKLICADDMLTPDCIEKEVKALVEHPDVLLVESDTLRVDMAGKGKGTYKRYKKSGVVDGKEVSKKGFFICDYFGAPLANMFRRSLYEEIGGFDKDFVYILDYEYFMRIACRGNIYIIHELLNQFRIRNDSNTGEVIAGDKTKIYVAEHRKLLEKYKDVLGLNGFQVELSVLIRRLRNVAAYIYLKVFIHK